jgi:hypothetical protein
MQSPTLLSTLVENESIFVCKGYSTIKVTRDGKAELFKLPIKTNGVAEYQEKIASQAPRPPSTMEFVKADSAEGRALGLTKDALQRVFDLTDEAYVKAINAHNDEFNWRVAVYGLDIEWKKADGSMAETYEEKKGHPGVKWDNWPAADENFFRHRRAIPIRNGARGFFIRELIGFERSDEMRLKRRSLESGSGQTPTSFFSDIATAKAFHMSPADFASLPRIDKKILHYQHAKQAVYDDVARTNAQQRAQAERPRKRRP